MAGRPSSPLVAPYTAGPAYVAFLLRPSNAVTTTFHSRWAYGVAWVGRGGAPSGDHSREQDQPDGGGGPPAALCRH
ncbi:MAG: hypothetical protein ACR2KL_04105 [Nocardioidaceae bacterium]